jgi:hypothetical protein
MKRIIFVLMITLMAELYRADWEKHWDHSKDKRS